MKIYSYIREVGIPILFLVFIFLLNPYELGIKTGYAIIPVLIALKGRTLVNNIDKEFMLILAISVTYSAFEYFVVNRGMQYLFIQAAFPVVFYSIGRLMVNKNISDRGILILLISIGIVYSATAVLSIITDLRQGGLSQTNRSIASYWTGSEILATGMAGYLIYNTLIPSLLLVNKQKLGLFGIAAFMALFFVNLIAGFRLGSRTLVVILILSLLLSIFLLFRHQRAYRNIRLLFLLILGGVAFYLFVPFDLDASIFSTLGQRLQRSDAVESTATAGNRVALWKEGLENLVRYPLGWESQRFHHNLWLDMAKKATIIPLLLFLIHNFLCYLNLKKLTVTQPVDFGLNVAFFMIILACYLLFFTEPIMEGNFFAFVVYFLFYGIMVGYIRKREFASTKNEDD